MAFELTDTGLTIETQQEIFDSLAAAVHADLGPDYDLGPDSQDGVILQITAMLFTTLQGQVSSIVTGTDKDQASGAQLNGLASIIGASRRPAAKSTISIVAQGTPGTDISSKLVQYRPTGSLWRTPESTIIGADGTVSTQLVATSTGAIMARAAPSSQWVIVEAVTGWSAVFSTIDATPGEAAAQDSELRQAMDLAAAGAAKATTPANLRNIAQVQDVVSVRLFENPTLSPYPDAQGLTGKQALFLVEGGLDEDVGRAIFESYAGDNELTGAVNPVFNYEFTDPDTDSLRTLPVNWIFFGRVTVERPFLRVTLDTTGAPNPLVDSDDIRAAIRNAMDAFGDSTLQTGDAVIPIAFHQPVLSVLPEGSITGLTIEAKKLVADPYQTQPLIYAPSERPDVVGSPRPAELTGGVGPYSLLGGDILEVAVDGGAPQQVEFDPIDFVQITAAQPLEVAAVLTDNVTGATGGVTAQRVTLTADSVGLASELTVTIDPGLFFGLVTVNGFDSRVEIVVI